MIVTTMGSEYWPRSLEGRILCLFLSIYAFAVFGYVTASLASLFVENDARSGDTDIPNATQIDDVRRQIAELHKDLHSLAEQLRANSNQRIT